MKTIIIHLSDIHLNPTGNPSESKFDLIAKALQNEELALDAAIVVVSGDIAFSGTPTEYQVAFRCLEGLQTNLMTRLQVSEVRFVFVPGNHDCDFSVANSVRDIVIDGIRGGKSVDLQMVNCCCDVQAAFTNFRDAFPNGKPDLQHSQLHWEYECSDGEFSIQFRCFNTAWMSQKKEQQGGIHIPDGFLGVLPSGKKPDYVVSVFHHPYNWMPSATYRRFRAFIEESSDLVLTGHEHEPDHYQKYSFSGEVNDYLEGAVFQEHGRDDRSGFHAA